MDLPFFKEISDNFKIFCLLLHFFTAVSESKQHKVIAQACEVTRMSGG